MEIWMYIVLIVAGAIGLLLLLSYIVAKRDEKALQALLKENEGFIGSDYDQETYDDDDYDEQYKRGQRDGFQQGLADGRIDYHDEFARDQHEHKAQGYHHGFQDGYDDGFDEGKDQYDELHDDDDDIDDNIDDDDLAPDHPSDPTLVSFTYRNQSGNESKRSGRFIRKEGRHQFMIWDEDKDGQRTFYTDAIICWHYGESNLQRRK